MRPVGLWVERTGSTGEVRVTQGEIARAIRVALDVLASLIRDAQARIAYAKPG